MANIMKKKPFRKSEAVSSSGGEKYIDLGEMTFHDEALASEVEGTTVKVGEIYRYEDLSNMTSHVYDGDILILDYSGIAGDDSAMRRVTDELKYVARDTGGDVAAIGKDLLIVTPKGLKVDRNKLKGGF